MENPRIDGIDWRNLQKGDKIPKEKVLDFWNIHFKDKPWDERTSLLQVKGCIEKLREGINRPLVIRQRDYELFVLLLHLMDQSFVRLNREVQQFHEL